MKDIVTKKLVYALLYLISAILVEVITFTVLGFGFFPSYFWIDLMLIFAIAAFVFALPGYIAQTTVSLILLLVQIALSCLNEALNEMSGIVFSLSMLNLAKEVGGVFMSDFVNWGLLYGLIMLLGAAALVMLFTYKNKKPQKTYFRDNVIILLLFLLISQNAFTVTNFTVETVLSSSSYSYSDDLELWETQYISKKAYRKFGTFGYYYMNVKNAVGDIFKDKSSSSVSDTTLLDYYFSTGEMSATEYDDIYTGKLDGKNVVLIVMESGEWYAINKEYTPTLYALANQGIAMTNYHARDKTNHSEAMSILGSYPVNTSIISMIEHDFAFTLPNIISGNGYTTNYFHANTQTCYDRDKTFSALYGFENTHYTEDMPLLKGYSDKENFYDFDKDSEIFKNYADEYTKVNSDDKAFYTMHMTLTSHGNYKDLVELGDYKYMTDEEKERFSERCGVKNMEEYYELIDGYPTTFIQGTPAIDTEYLSSALTEKEYADTYLYYKRYQAGITDLDVGVNYLVNKLSKEGKLKDTAFVIYSDHNAYYHSLNYNLKGVPLNESYNTTLYNIPFFIWSGGTMNLSVSAVDIEGYSSIEHIAQNGRSPFCMRKVDKFCSSFDVLPTLLQLLGYSYNENMYHGKSVFSYDESVFVSRESGIMTDDIYYDGMIIYRKEDNGIVGYDYEGLMAEGALSEDLQAFVEDSREYYFKQSYLEKMYSSDYFKNRDIFSEFVFENGLKLNYITKL